MGAPGTSLSSQAAESDPQNLELPGCLGCWRLKALVVMEPGILATLKCAVRKRKLSSFWGMECMAV